jgi:hypothetical protein
MNETENYFNNLLGQSANWLLLFSIIPIIIALKKWKFLSQNIKYFFWYLFSIFFLNIFTQALLFHFDKYYKTFWKPILEKLQIENSHFLNIFVHLITIYFIGNMYKALTANILYKKVLFYFSIILIFVGLINYFLFDGYRYFGLYIPLAVSLFIIFLSANYIWQISNRPSSLSIIKNPFFWISICLFLKTLIEIFFILIGDKLYEENFLQYVRFQLAKNILDFFGLISFGYSFLLVKNLKYLR